MGRTYRPRGRDDQYCLFGAGLIGSSVHAGNLARHPKVRFRYIVDPRRGASDRLAMSGAGDRRTVTALDDPTLDAVMIASATRPHADLAMAAATRGKAIFCEKPIDLDIGRTDACLAAVAKAGVIFQIGFNRRFDPSFHALKQRLDSGVDLAVGRVIKTKSDPEPGD
jgi:myo-inositol 2-dehydrogenase/D-chiro-inositol 1-dehydrogenase